MQATEISARQLTDELMTFLVTTMKTAQSEVFKIVEELDLSMTQLKMLFVLDGSDGELTPSELAKLAVIFYLAWFLERRRRPDSYGINDWKHTIFPALGPVLSPSRQ